MSDSVTTWTVAYQSPLSMEFSRQEYWSGLPFPYSWDLPDPGIESGFPYCRQTLYHLSHQGSPTIEPLQHRAGPQEAEQLPGRECYPTLQQIIVLSFTEQSPDHQFSSVQSLSPVWLLATTWTAACQASLSITNSKSLLKLMSIKLVKPSNHFILWHPLLLLPSVFHRIRVFSNEIVLHFRWSKYWSFHFSISPSNEYSELISFRIDLLDLLAVLETQESSPTSIVQKH